MKFARVPLSSAMTPSTSLQYFAKSENLLCCFFYEKKEREKLVKSFTQFLILIRIIIMNNLYESLISRIVLNVRARHIFQDIFFSTSSICFLWQSVRNRSPSHRPEAISKQFLKWSKRNYTENVTVFITINKQVKVKATKAFGILWFFLICLGVQDRWDCLIHSKLNYICETYSFAIPIALRMLDSDHNDALRICTGVPGEHSLPHDTTKVSAICYCQIDFQPPRGQPIPWLENEQWNLVEDPNLNLSKALAVGTPQFLIGTF